MTVVWMAPWWAMPTFGALVLMAASLGTRLVLRRAGL